MSHSRCQLANAVSLYIIQYCAVLSCEMNFKLTSALNNSIDAINVTLEMKHWTLINSLPPMEQYRFIFRYTEMFSNVYETVSVVCAFCVHLVD